MMMMNPLLNPLLLLGFRGIDEKFKALSRMIERMLREHAFGPHNEECIIM